MQILGGRTISRWRKREREGNREGRGRQIGERGEKDRYRRGDRNTERGERDSEGRGKQRGERETER